MSNARNVGEAISIRGTVYYIYAIGKPVAGTGGVRTWYLTRDGDGKTFTVKGTAVNSNAKPEAQ